MSAIVLPNGFVVKSSADYLSFRVFQPWLDLVSERHNVVGMNPEEVSARAIADGGGGCSLASDAPSIPITNRT